MTIASWQVRQLAGFCEGRCVEARQVVNVSGRLPVGSWCKGSLLMTWHEWHEKRWLSAGVLDLLAMHGYTGLRMDALCFLRAHCP